MIYIFILVLLLIGAYRYDFSNHDRGKDKYFNFCFFIVLLISAIKYRVGSDIPVYMEEYDYTPTISNLTRDYLFNSFNRQFGWQLFMSICKTVTSSFLLPQALMALYINYAIYRYLRKYTSHIFLGLLLYYFLIYIEFNFESIRQTVSIAFFIISVEYYNKKNWKIFYLLVFGAYAFHSSAIILFFIPLLRLLKFERINKYLFVAIGIVFIIYLPQITSRLPALFYLMETDVDVHHFDVMEVGAFSYFGNIMQFLIYFFISTFLNNEEYGQRKWYFPFLYLYFICLFCSWGLPFFGRISNYFIIFFIAASADTLSNKRCIKYFHLIFILFLLYSSIGRYTKDWEGVPALYKYYPYHSYFDQEKETIRESRIERFHY